MAKTVRQDFVSNKVFIPDTLILAEIVIKGVKDEYKKGVILEPLIYFDF